MQVEYLADGSDDCPLLRIFQFTPGELSTLVDRIHCLAKSELQAFALEGLPGVTLREGLAITFEVSDRDEGLAGAFPEFRLRLVRSVGAKCWSLRSLWSAAPTATSGSARPGSRRCFSVRVVTGSQFEPDTTRALRRRASELPP